jgi:hypothetical protein
MKDEKVLTESETRVYYLGIHAVGCSCNRKAELHVYQGYRAVTGRRGCVDRGNREGAER